MERYGNLGGDSGVKAYQIGQDSIHVAFRDGSVYLYTYQSAGRSAVERMKALAVEGHGLNAFINKHVKRNYEARLR